MSSEILGAGLNNLYADRVIFIGRSTIMVYFDGPMEEAQKQLNQWADEGYIEILKPLSEAITSDPCIKLLSFIQKK